MIHHISLFWDDNSRGTRARVEGTSGDVNTSWVSVTSDNSGRVVIHVTDRHAAQKLAAVINEISGADAKDEAPAVEIA